MSAFGVGETYVPICGMPNAKVHEYFSQNVFVIRPRSADPDSMSGAGRYGYVVERTVDVFVVTQSLDDEGGNDAIAIGRHCDREDSLVSCLCLNPPIDTTYGLIGIGKTIKWIPGGEDIMRQVATDPGLIASCLCFQIMYPANILVFRDA